MSVDAVGDFLTIIRNGLFVSKTCVTAPYSKLKHEVAKILLDEGFIRGIEVVGEAPAEKKLKITLKYIDGESVIHEIQRASVPGCRAYSGANNVAPVAGGLGISILTTNKGVMTHRDAKRLEVGGEVLCTVW